MPAYRRKIRFGVPDGSEHTRGIDQGLIFDFDGLIVDTETPLLRAWQEIYVELGLEPLEAEIFIAGIGRNDSDPELINPYELLAERLGRPVDRDEIDEARRPIRDRLIDAEPVRPGVVDLLDAAAQIGAPVAVASSSSHGWVEGHLGDRGLLDRFAVVACAAGTDIPGKPEPDVYLRAIELLGVDAAGSIALEDSPTGALGAKRAGLHCIAVPAGLTAELDFAVADQAVPSLTDIDLAAALAKLR